MSKKCEQGFEVDGEQSPRPFGGRHSVSVNAYPTLLTQPFKFTATGPKHPASRFHLLYPITALASESLFFFPLTESQL